MGDLERRVAVLERSARRWRRLAVAASLAGAVGLLVGATKGAGEVRAHKLVVLDKYDRERVVIDCEFPSAASIRMTDPSGNARMMMSASELGASIGMNRTNPKSQLTLDAGDRVGAHLWFAEPPGDGIYYPAPPPRRD